MKTRAPLLLALLAALALGASACGDDEKDEKSDEAKQEQQATPQQAVAEIAETKRLIYQAADRARAGKKAAAETLAEQAYLEHFEIVEGPLEKVDEELNEELEEQIREEFRQKIASGASAAEITKLVSEINDGLDEAQQKLE